MFWLTGFVGGEMGCFSFLKKMFKRGGQSASAGKPKLSELIMSVKKSPSNVVKRSGEMGLWTGYMGDCVSLIVRYNRPINDVGCMDMKGQHGNGGVGNIDVDSLVQGISSSQIVGLHLIGSAVDLYSVETFKAELEHRFGRNKVQVLKASEAVVLQDGSEHTGAHSQYEITPAQFSPRWA
jgi:hypothetical protein